jgi:hypothetical protein
MTVREVKIRKLTQTVHRAGEGGRYGETGMRWSEILLSMSIWYLTICTECLYICCSLMNTIAAFRVVAFPTRSSLQLIPLPRRRRVLPQPIESNSMTRNHRAQRTLCLNCVNHAAE